MKRMKAFLHKDGVFIFLMLLPSLLMVAAFTYYPLSKGILMAFQDYSLFNLSDTKWVGLSNFRTLFSHDPANTFYTTIWNTLKWVAVSLLAQLLLGFLMALLLRRDFFGSKLYRGLIFFPWAVSGFIIGIMWRWMFNGTSGVFNDLLLRFGLIQQPIGWLSGTGTALNSVIAANIWYGVPFFTIMISAALKSVPVELYEASAVDGAGKTVQFFHITLPQIKRVVLLTVLLRVIWIFNFPDLIYSMTGGGPGGSSEIITSYMMKKVQGLDYGMGSAVGVVVLVLLSIYTAVYLWLTRSNEIEES